MQRRERALANIHSVAEAEHRKQLVRQTILSLLGDLPDYRGPLKSGITGTIQSEGFKGSNHDWMSPSDPDARITKMKDGRTHLTHKAEDAVDPITRTIWPFRRDSELAERLTDHFTA